MAGKTYSIHAHFSGGAVFLTGASGYVGALVLEKLLRCTDIDTVFVMLRAKKDEAVQVRLDKMLNASPLMHLLRDNPVLGKVRAVAGDMKAAGLGISNDDLRLLRQEVHTVIHCAADIRLEVGIQELLTTNYEGTRQLLELAKTFDCLKAFVHVSSAYTNMNAVPGSLVQESIYPLSYGDQPVVDSELVQELLSMPAHNANLRAEGLLAQWNFPNNYTLSKHLAEYMVADFQQHEALPVAIVRPTLISSVARDPYPGYTGNYAGHVGATLAFMAGLFDSPAASNYKASNVWDVIPADITANVILAAAAALGQGAATSCCLSPTRVYPAQQQQQQHAVQAASGSLGADRQHESSAGALLIVHCGSSTTYPLTIMESWNWGVEVYGAWPMVPNLSWGKCAGPMLSSHEPNPQKAAHHMLRTSWKIWAACKLLGLCKKDQVARKLKIGFESFKIINQPKTDVNLRFSSNNMQKLASLLCPTEQDDFLLLWKPQASRQCRFSSCAATPSLKPNAAVKEEQQALNPNSPRTGAEDFRIKAAAADGTTSGSVRSRADITSESRIQEINSSACGAAPGSNDVVDGRSSHGACLTPEAAEAVSKMRSIPLEWRTFHINLGAYLYCTMFKMPLPANEMRIAKPQVSRWLHIRPEDQFIRHQFVLYK